MTKMLTSKGLKKFWKDIKLFLLAIEEILSAELQALRKIHTYNWRPVNPAYVELSGGFFVPRVSIEHRLLYLGYETELVNSFLDLYKEINREKNNRIAAFSIRSLYELGFPRTQLIFDKRLKKKTRNLFALIIVLSDYSYLAYNNENFFNDFKKLLKEEKDLLTTEEINFKRSKITLYEFYEEVVDSINKKERDKNQSLCKKSRRKILDFQGKYFKNKSKLLDIFNPINVDAMYWSYSHLLHGNSLLLRTLFTDKRLKREKLKMCWALMMTGLNVAHFVALRLGDKAIIRDVDNVKRDFRVLAQIIKTSYPVLEK